MRLWPAIVASALLFGCGPKAGGPRHATSDDELVTGPPDLRKMVALVKVTPPPKLAKAFESLSQRTQNEQFAMFLHAFAEGGSGSGFVVVVEKQGRKEELVVTNRHVVSGATEATLKFTDGRAFERCEIVYADQDRDLAIVAFPSGATPFDYGFGLTSAPAKDLQTVIATGFPEMAGRPSYRTTEGKVSNAEFTIPTDEPTMPAITFIEHTAPIDPGNSGGPLTTESGQVVGVNTWLLRDKHSAFYAIPAPRVREVIDAAFEVRAKRGDAAWMRASLVGACRSLATELASDSPKPGALDDLVSNALVAEHGVQAFVALSDDRRVVNIFAADPMDGMRKAIVVHLLVRFERSGGVAKGNTCAELAEEDLASITKPGAVVRLTMAMNAGPLATAWTFEHGHWRLADVDMRDPSDDTANED